MKNEKGFSLEHGLYGPRVILKGEWSVSVEQYLLNQNIAELEINHAKGWRGKDIEFVARFPCLVSLTIIDRELQDTSPIHALHRLKSLRVLTYSDSEINFGEFPELRQCGLEWRDGASSIFNCANLEELFINRYDHQDTSAFAKLKNLESLTLLGGAIRSLKGLSHLSRLKSLRLGDLKHLSGLAGIKDLSQLEILEINTCRFVGEIEEIAQLTDLNELYLNNIGSIDSIRPLRCLNNLLKLTFYESTDVLDGDMTPLLSLPRLQMVSFKNRKHYSHTREAITRLLPKWP